MPTLRYRAGCATRLRLQRPLDKAKTSLCRTEREARKSKLRIKRRDGKGGRDMRLVVARKKQKMLDRFF